MPEPLQVERAFFRETADGSTVFFPWGLTHRGYRLDGEGARRKAHRAASLLIGSAIGIGTWTAYLLEPLLRSGENGAREIVGALAAPGAALVLVLGGYWLWASRFVERFPPSDLEVSRETRLREAAELAEPGKVALVGVVLCGLSAFLVWLQPRGWWLGLLGVALGVFTVWWSVLLRRAARPPSG